MCFGACSARFSHSIIIHGAMKQSSLLKSSKSHNIAFLLFPEQCTQDHTPAAGCRDFIRLDLFLRTFFVRAFLFFIIIAFHEEFSLGLFHYNYFQYDFLWGLLCSAIIPNLRDLQVHRKYLRMDPRLPAVLRLVRVAHVAGRSIRRPWDVGRQES